ncbi:MAG: peptidoglycan-binding protein, partial [Candidatus Spyradocola sp.]
MATYSTIKKGSTGSSVTELQQLLNANGYNLATDGIYGSKTAAAVRDYQAKNGLSVDGITGTQTWTSLYGGGNTGSDTSGS